MFKIPKFYTSTMYLFFFLFNINAYKKYTIRYASVNKLIFFLML